MIIHISPVGGLYVACGGMSSQVDVVYVGSGETSRGPSHAAAASTTSLFVLSGVDGGILNSCEFSNVQVKQ